MPDVPTHARILALLETVEAHEQDRRPLRLDDLGAALDRAAAEVRWLEAERLARFDVLGDCPRSASRLAALTPHGKGALALMRGDASSPGIVTD